LKDVVKPFQEKPETVYVVPGSDAEEYVAKRYPHKTIKPVGNSLNRLRSIPAFLNGLTITFQRNQAKGIDCTYHFTFTGREECRATVTIRKQQIKVENGHVGSASLRVAADTDTWLGFIAKERSLVWSLLRRKIRIKGSPRLLQDFARCFPS
jgi:alkyl sulfatase BDS1-like metallo-beta-lactamase superfamily hydrolase